MSTTGESSINFTMSRELFLLGTGEHDKYEKSLIINTENIPEVHSKSFHRFLNNMKSTRGSSMDFSTSRELFMASRDLHLAETKLNSSTNSKESSILDLLKEPGCIHTSTYLHSTCKLDSGSSDFSFSGFMLEIPKETDEPVLSSEVVQQMCPTLPSEPHVRRSSRTRRNTERFQAGI